MSRTREAAQSTVTQVESRNPQPLETDSSVPRVTGTLRLRGEPAQGDSRSEEREARARQIRWAEDVVDNEGLGKKSSKVCCIYHKTRPVGESSSESDSSDSGSSANSDSDSQVDDDGNPRMNNGPQLRHSHRRHDHPLEPDRPGNPHDQAENGSSCSHHRRKRARGRPARNAYERVPKSFKKDQGTEKLR